ncbi:PASTA domain-containing protein [Mycolicibacterium gilvum]|uniref:PASTA domain-containing protein n=2 Tax=Mycolicibacterium gilvum TaxID=1804 RepID=E6TH87_MYCSR|nr:PASTA domain-containing protein [Mycolicibacterium gilvum]ADT99027.1 hypothetical protein Mspyr1_23850 [Mycolicibacterium gilvum Spyr1]MCV7054462.1 PASTA domain-containing protein [Mycolicibacterium gilvum]STZ44106.1 Uncharacterised protein [Mycolicibacterium gilvum]
MKSHVRLAGATSLVFAAAIAAAAPAAADQWVMPDVTGQLLQDARNAVLAASDGVVLPAATTAEGPVFEEENLTSWQVCTQSPSAGTVIPDDTPPTLTVARPGACASSE